MKNESPRLKRKWEQTQADSDVSRSRGIEQSVDFDVDRSENGEQEVISFSITYSNLKTAALIICCVFVQQHVYFISFLFFLPFTVLSVLMCLLIEWFVIANKVRCFYISKLIFILVKFSSLQTIHIQYSC